MTLQEIKDEIIEYGKARGEKWNFDKGNGKGLFIECLDTFSLNYMVLAVDYVLNKQKKKKNDTSVS